MKQFFYIGILVFSVLFMVFCFPSDKHEYIAKIVTERTAKKLEEKKQLYLAGTGGRMMDDVKEMDMSFDYYKEVDLNQARELILYAINEYLSDINNSAELRPYLHSYPFNPNNIEIRICIRNTDTSNDFLNKLYFISFTDGIIHYYMPSEERYSRKLFYEEKYEEARLKLSQNER